jgi:hypothetical protein
MGFVLDGLETEAYDRSYGDRELLARIVRYFRPYRRQMALVGVAIALNSAAGTGGPILISRAIDRVGHDAATPTLLLLAGGSCCWERRPGDSTTFSSGCRPG